MERLTETKFEKEMRIGFAKIDRIFDDAISKLDAMKAECQKKLMHTSDARHCHVNNISYQDQLRGMLINEKSYTVLQQINANEKCNLHGVIFYPTGIGHLPLFSI